MEQAIQDVLRRFEVGQDGYPSPGKIVKYYRERMIYIDHRGRERHWTQKDLAEKLGISEVMVNLMEKHNQGLDSIERRRLLASLLKIPPVLLGLGSLDQVVEITVGQHALISPPESTIKSMHDYKKSYDVYKQIYRDGLSYTMISNLERLTQELSEYAKNKTINDLLYILWQYEILCAKIFSSDFKNWPKTFEHVDNAKDIAMHLEDSDLQAASLCHSAIFHFRQGRIGLAKMDIDGAALYARGAALQTRGIIASKSACIYVDSDTSTSGIVLAQNMIDSAEKYIDAKDDVHAMSFGKDDFYLDKSYVLNVLHRYGKALECLDDAERYVQSAGKRHTIFLDIKRAQFYIEQKKPEYEQAVWMLLNAVETSKEIRVSRNIEQVKKLYDKLADSSYQNSPDVIELRLALRRLQVPR